MARGIQFICVAMVFGLLGTILFASGPATRMLSALAPQAGSAPSEGLPGRAGLLAQNNAKGQAADPLDDLFQTEKKPTPPANPPKNPPKGKPDDDHGQGPGGEEDHGNLIINAVRKLWGDLNDTELDGANRQEGVRILDKADDELRRQREVNMRGILSANRQLRVKRCERTNVLVIMLDDVGFGALGCYGQQMIATPYIDRLAAKSVRFTQFYAGSSQDVPARGTYLSARHTGRGEQHGNEWITVRKADFTLPKVMYQGGFDTGYMGKWGMGDVRFAGKPHEQGVNEFYGYLSNKEAENLFPEYLWRNTAKVEIEANKNGNKVEYSPNLITTEAIKFLKNHSPYRHVKDAELGVVNPNDKKRLMSGYDQIPFFLTVSYSMPVTATGADVPSDAPYTSTNWPQAKKNYASMITGVDALVGKILSALERYDLEGSTIVILTSDNGPRANEVVDTQFFETTGQLRGQQVELFDGAIRVPLLIHEPRRGNRGGFDSSRVWAMWDLPVTIAQMTSCMRRPQQVDGKSQIDSLDEWSYELAELSKAKKGDEMLYWEVREGELAQAVRSGDWKAVRVGAKGKWQLYNLKSDLGEAKDVAAENPDLVKTIDEFAARAQAPPAMARRGEEE